ncbi:MAG TPA: DUF4202 domain-containing protein [Acidimicrobiales bacterium]
MGDDRLARALDAIDRANADDPETIVVRGERRAKEQAHAVLMTEWVQRLDPSADDAQLLAARAHHLRRWSIPRATFPDGRAGYLRWRTTLNRQHATEVAAILTEVGYSKETVDRVQRIIRKEGLKTDPAVQTHEDALCLVFLETQLDELADRLGDDKSVDVIAKTLQKMSAKGIDTALGLALDQRARDLVERAIRVTQKP